MFGLTPRAVRFYEERGLVESRRDRFNCRTYDSRARGRLEQIAAYRQVGLSLDDIIEIFSCEAEGAAVQRECAMRKLKARLTQIEAARRQTESLLQRFDADSRPAPGLRSSNVRRLAVAG
jgi:DNA-binding transcriptional MerR regulator